MHLPLLVQRRLNRGRPALRLYWWRFRHPVRLNFGDEVTQYLIERLWGLSCVWTDPSECDVVGAGSVIEILQKRADGRRIRVWGSGLIKEGDKNVLPNLRFFAVRGPLTASRVQVAPGARARGLVQGDPALLVGKVFRRPRRRTHDVGLVAHYVDADHPLVDRARQAGYLIIDPLDPPAAVAAHIASCRFVLSSSLHGLIFADSLGVPNRWMPLSGKLSGGRYKFDAYYRSTGRTAEAVDADAVIGNGALVAECVRGYVPVRNLRRMQRDLVRAFPYDRDVTARGVAEWVRSRCRSRASSARSEGP